MEKENKKLRRQRTLARKENRKSGNSGLDLDSHCTKSKILGKGQKISLFSENEERRTSISLPQLVEPDGQTDEKWHQDYIPAEDSTFSLNRFSTLPPIHSDTFSVRAAGFIGLNRPNSRGNRNKLPPISQQQMEEKPEDGTKPSKKVSTRKKKLAIEDKRVREMRNKERLERHAQKRKENTRVVEEMRAMRIERHMNKFDTAERNKEQIRQQRKRKLEQEENKRRKAKERLNAQRQRFALETREEKMCVGEELCQFKLPDL